MLIFNLVFVIFKRNRKKMKHRGLQKITVDEIKRFIVFTCEGDRERSIKHTSFHKELVNRYFEAKNAEIFYEENKILAEIFIGKGCVPISFDCQNISVFLRSCVKEDQESLEVYQNYMNTFSRD